MEETGLFLMIFSTPKEPSSIYAQISKVVFEGLVTLFKVISENLLSSSCPMMVDTVEDALLGAGTSVELGGQNMKMLHVDNLPLQTCETLPDVIDAIVDGYTLIDKSLKRRVWYGAQTAQSRLSAVREKLTFPLGCKINTKAFIDDIFDDASLLKKEMSNIFIPPAALSSFVEIIDTPL